MFDFESYLDKTGEVGYVDQVVDGVVTVVGLPQVGLGEVVVFENGEKGQVLALTEDKVEILPLCREMIDVGKKVTRTGERLMIKVSESLIGLTVGGLGAANGVVIAGGEDREVESQPVGLEQRRAIDKPLQTGASIVDLVVPLGKGQRELVIGDRKTGKSDFLLQLLLSQAKAGVVCVYALIGQKKSDLAKIEGFLQAKGISNQVVVVAETAGSPVGLIFLTPYTAMTIAEYLRDKGRDVVVILDDMTTHAKFYRQIALLSRRFPGRNSYPGDIFYAQAQIMERAGNFATGSISCLPVAESVWGDISGYIQTNLMSMTDGHLFFDSELASLGRLPAINPFLSVTRVGRQAQTELLRDISRELGRWLNMQNRLRQFMHFGAELTERVQRILALGDRVYKFFNLSWERIVPTGVSILAVGGLWAGVWEDASVEQMGQEIIKLIERYEQDANYKNEVDKMIGECKTLIELVAKVKQKRELVTNK